MDPWTGAGTQISSNIKSVPPAWSLDMHCSNLFRIFMITFIRQEKYLWLQHFGDAVITFIRQEKYEGDQSSYHRNKYSEQLWTVDVQISSWCDYKPLLMLPRCFWWQQKNAHWWSTFVSKSKRERGGCSFEGFWDLTWKSAHVIFTVNWMTYNRAKNGFKVNAWWHATLQTAPCHFKHVNSSPPWAPH